MRRAAALLTAVAALAPAGARAAWTEPAGKGIVISTVTVITADERRRVEVSPYLQYGLTDGWTLVAQPTFAHNTGWQDADGDMITDAGLSKVFLASRHRVWQAGPDVVSIQPGLTFGIGDRERARRLGAGDTIAEFRALWGHGFTFSDPFGEGEIEGFTVFEIAPRLPEGTERAELEADLTLGLRQDGTLYLFQALNKFPLGPATPDYRKHQIQPSTVMELTADMALQLGSTYTYAGRNVDREIAGFFAIWLHF